MLAFLNLPYSKENLFDALKELLSVLFFGFLPIILGLLFAWLLPGGSVAQFMLGFLASGEALLLSTTLVGPLIYVLVKNYGDFPSLSGLLTNYDNLPKTISIKFPFGWFFISVIVLICVIAAAVFGYNSALSNVDKELVSKNVQILSSIIILLSLFVFFWISIARNNLLDGAAKLMSDDTNSFLDEWGEE